MFYINRIGIETRDAYIHLAVFLWASGNWFSGLLKIGTHDFVWYSVTLDGLITDFTDFLKTINSSFLLRSWIN